MEVKSKFSCGQKVDILDKNINGEILGINIKIYDTNLINISYDVYSEIGMICEIPEHNISACDSPMTINTQFNLGEVVSYLDIDRYEKGLGCIYTGKVDGIFIYIHDNGNEDISYKLGSGWSNIYREWDLSNDFDTLLSKLIHKLD